MVPPLVMVGYRVKAVVGDALCGLGGQHLQEGDLVAVGLVSEGEALGWDIREPCLSLTGLIIDLFGFTWFWLDTGGGNFRFHVAVHQDSILGISSIGINPVLVEEKNVEKD